MTKLNENLTALGQELTDFEQKIQVLAGIMKVKLSDYEIDHLALRVNSEQNAKNWLTLLLKYGKILSDNIVNGRPIYLIQLEKPLAFAGQFVDVIELPFPKKKQYPQETWEHIEIVMPFLLNESTEHWVERICNHFLWQRVSQLTIKVSEPKVEGEQLPNPSIAVSLADKTANHTCIKIHPYSIKKILEV
ncbi:VOC family protein [Rodentibacter myodis]|uniref:Metalloprotein n=1 Tax=Rodentibacter myodis TaxID=1907939 RepID=A0A1V3JNB1_9PAST|nr:VOC family protein [Rodentibacter myodis]OOF58164.1 metalloprotein [Rodentibacter myodis]